ncbi:ABC transporter substrate-binding protein [Paenibacillus sp. 1P07SE]|uniref:ABC transporter substrate-binding protein n=1 Tax=Paenibacillus sp. 1P07SE TaxID=3132209 RepID=UPI0039A6C504
MGQQPWRKWMFTGLSVALMVPLLAACTGDGGGTGAENRVLRIGVLYGGEENEPWFRQQYTDMFEFNNTNIEIQIVPAIDYNNMRFMTPDQQNEQPDPYEEMQKMLNGDNPVDVVVTEFNMLRRLVQDNSLKQLDPLMQEDGFSVEDYVPTVINGIKTAGDGSIYALTPTFISSALYYNKKMFSDAGVEPPTDGMQWPDVINKARLVTSGEGEDRKYGFMMNRWSGDGFWDLQTYVEPLQLRIFDEKVEKMLVNSDQWANAWGTISGLHIDKIVPNMMEMQSGMGMMGDRPYNPFEHDPFVSGKVAMMIGDYYYLNELKRAQQSEGNVDGFEMIDWDVVTVPEHPEKPGVGSNIHLSALMGINAKAQNPDDAWEYIKFVNSEAWAKLRSRSVNEMVSRQQFLKPRDGMDYNLAAFYSMEPSQPMSLEMELAYRKYPNIYEVQSLGQPLFQEVVEGKKSVQEALAEWETQGDALLQQMKANPDASIGGTEGSADGSTEGGEAQALPAG